MNILSWIWIWVDEVGVMSIDNLPIGADIGAKMIMGGCVWEVVELMSKERAGKLGLIDLSDDMWDDENWVIICNFRNNIGNRLNEILRDEKIMDILD